MVLYILCSLISVTFRCHLQNCVVCFWQIMSIQSDHWVWKRDRPDYHAGAVRSYTREKDDDGHPRGPDVTPRLCVQCRASLEYDSVSPGSTSWYLSSSAESSPDITHYDCHSRSHCLRLVPNSSRFDMKGNLSSKS